MRKRSRLDSLPGLRIPFGDVSAAAPGLALLPPPVAVRPRQRCVALRGRTPKLYRSGEGPFSHQCEPELGLAPPREVPLGNKAPRRMLLNVVVGLAILYAGVCGALFLCQRSMIYFPPPISECKGGSLTALEIENGRVLVSTRPRDGPDALIYLGGNAENVSLNMPDLSAAFPGHALYLLHYRGYCGSPGRPSEEALFGDALALVDRVRALHPNVVIAGRSLGSGIAIRVASLRTVSRLVLVTPYDSLQEIAARQFPYVPVRWLLRDKFESWRYAPQVTAPTLIIAAELDEVIPRASSELLRTRFQHGVASMVVIAGTGHNTISASRDYLRLMKDGR